MPMAALDPSFRVFFTTLQESLKLHKDSMPGLMDKNCPTTLKFLPPCWNELLRSKTAHLDEVSFAAAHLRSSAAATSRPWLSKTEKTIRQLCSVSFLEIEDISGRSF